jgi:hypothetical protein
MKQRKNLSGEALHRLISQVFEKIPDHRKRQKSVTVKLRDALMSGFAVFALKLPSLLQFDEYRKEYPNKLKALFGIESAPCDTQMREVVDEVDPDSIRQAYKRVLFEVQRGKGLEGFVYYQGHYLIAADGTGHFSSDSVHCEDCLVKESKSGKIHYQHQMLAAAIVHPDQKIVLPLCPEPIKKQDGSTKNDCERNAGKRFLKKFREDHPKLKAIFVEDALSGNTPRIEDLNEANVRFILGAKPGSNKYLFDQVDRLDHEGRMNRFESENLIGQKIIKTVKHRFRYLNGLRLNATHETTVNFLEYWETTEWIDKDGNAKKEAKHFSWITDLDIYWENLFILMRGGRARWGIENETFNSLKNQGYEFEHNFGHGYKHLSTCLGLLMVLAFLVDQVQQLSCELFQKALEKVHNTRRTLWQTIRVLFDQLNFTSWSQLLEAIAFPEKRQLIWINSS